MDSIDGCSYNQGDLAGEMSCNGYSGEAIAEALEKRDGVPYTAVKIKNNGLTFTQFVKRPKPAPTDIQPNTTQTNAQRLRPLRFLPRESAALPFSRWTASAQTAAGKTIPFLISRCFTGPPIRPQSFRRPLTGPESLLNFSLKNLIGMHAPTESRF